MTKFKKLIALFIMIIMSAGVFAGCGLFGKNLEAQLALPVAEIKKTVNGTEYYEIVTRRDLIVYFYNNNGSDYVNNQGMALEDVLTGFLDQLVSRKVFLIEGKIYFEANPYANPYGADFTSADFLRPTGAGDTDFTVFKDQKYLTNKELQNVELQVKYSNQENLNSYKDAILEEWFPKPETDEEEEAATEFNPAPNPRPDEPPKDPKAPKDWELSDIYFKGDDARRAALKAELEAEALLRLRRQIEIENFTDEDYNKRQIEAAIEQKIIEKYRDIFYNGILERFESSNYAELKEAFDALIAEQKELFDNDPSQFFSMATNPADGSFLLYYPTFDVTGGFKYITVKNLLIKFDSETETALSTLKSMINDTDLYIALRDTLIEWLVAKDRRDPYDVDGEENLYQEIFGEDADGEKDGTFSIAEFMQFIDSELANLSGDELIAKFTELIYAYGQDTGMFNNNYDYVVAPPPVVGATESFVTEFANKSREFTAVGQYDYAVTDFGLHVIMCTGIVDSGTELVFSTDDIINKNYDSMSYRFFNYIYSNVRDEEITLYQTRISDEYQNDGYVTKYIENIEDLWKQ